MKELAHLNKYLYKYRGLLLLGVLFTVLSNLFGVIPAQIVRHALELVEMNVDHYFLFRDSSFQTVTYKTLTFGITVLGGLIILMAIIKGVFLFAVRQTIIVMSRHIEYDLKNEIYGHYQTLPLAFFKQNSTGDLMARISEDVSKVRMYLGPAIMYLLNMFVLVGIVVSYMFSVNVRLTWFVLIPLPLLSLSIFIVSSIINRRSERIQKSLANLSTNAQETYSGIRVIKSFAAEDKFYDQFEKESLKYQYESLKLARVDSLFHPIMIFLIGMSTIICVYVGGQEVMAGKISLGVIAEFVMYVYMLTWPMTALGWTSGQIQRAAASQKRINEFLRLNNDIISTENLKVDIQGGIRFEHVSFVYPDTGIKALDNVSFEILPGESVAIIGTTASGKSTLANLILRLFDIQEGQIYIDGIELKKLDLSYYRSQLGYVTQEVFLFSDTITNNVKFGKEDATDEEVVKATQEAEVYHNIMGFPEGFNTKVGERGITLSGGQKQRISIARALIRKPQVLLLDDSLSAVDTVTENRILHHLKGIGKTTILISHRISNARLADKIILMDEGKVIDVGTHEELLSKGGLYAELHESQSSESLTLDS
ncbi:ABC transporter related protein [Leadbetterella byssophila DSM 17132]|uniref:ABC transporter related protein n=1 Tax=Leadbetterella byssophila (strain DSM 17132 / JCM 16389 / KACC 11308 / NBRC 106382 / 4M15) TaxID=649349 RepID=E4RY34_LEAB4|nr:ABC transporter ATP-binding protein [Leadbetterella byssophila]ADQ16362.1 ABC transporter related protein [Leadbetterella byssophila DSM 17132]